MKRRIGLETNLSLLQERVLNALEVADKVRDTLVHGASGLVKLILQVVEEAVALILQIVSSILGSLEVLRVRRKGRGGKRVSTAEVVILQFLKRTKTKKKLKFYKVKGSHLLRKTNSLEIKLTIMI